jgi:hypothetical protein
MSEPITEARQFAIAITDQLRKISDSSVMNAGIERCIERLEFGTFQFNEASKGHPPALHIKTLFDQALSDFHNAKPEVGPVTVGIKKLLPYANWIKRKAAPGQCDDFVERHSHAVLLGPNMAIGCERVTIGVAIMEPWVTYPFHQHAPEEFYLVLSEGWWYREGNGWWSPGMGGIVHNEPSVVHSMKSDDRPLLAVWGLLHES